MRSSCQGCSCLSSPWGVGRGPSSPILLVLVSLTACDSPHRSWADWRSWRALLWPPNRPARSQAPTGRAMSARGAPSAPPLRGAQTRSNASLLAHRLTLPLVILVEFPITLIDRRLHVQARRRAAAAVRRLRRAPVTSGRTCCAVPTATARWWRCGWRRWASSRTSHHLAAPRRRWPASRSGRALPAKTASRQLEAVLLPGAAWKAHAAALPRCRRRPPALPRALQVRRRRAVETSARWSRSGRRADAPLQHVAATALASLPPSACTCTPLLPT